MKRTAKTAVKSRGATAAVLVLALGAAVYLNWSFAREAPDSVLASDASADTQLVEINAEDETTVETAAEAGDSLVVLDPLESTTAEVSAEAESEAVETADKNYGEAQLVSVNKDSGSEFFESARLARSKARDEALDELKKALKNAAMTDEEKNELTEKLNTQLDNITLESKLETLIKAKGFADCVVNLNGEKADVTVMTENDVLTAAEVTRIRDVLLKACEGMQAQDITIVEVK